MYNVETINTIFFVLPPFPDELHHFIEENPYFVQDYLDFKDHPRRFCFGRPKSCNGQNNSKDE